MAYTATDSASAKRLIVVHPDQEVLAQATGARLLTRLLDVQSVRSPAHVVLTGGSLGIAVLAAAAASPLLSAVDWSNVHLWWGDERFLPDGDPQRNETQAREALLDGLVAEHGLLEANIHPMPGPTLVGTPQEGAALYAEQLAQSSQYGPEDTDQNQLPTFDILLLGMGPDGHIASLFPAHEGLTAQGNATGILRSPKPPPERVSLTLSTIQSAREVWVVVAGANKAKAVAAALANEPVEKVPAAGGFGHIRTLWLLDVEAAGAR